MGLYQAFEDRSIESIPTKIALAAVLLVTNVFHPLDNLPVQAFLDGNVGHGRSRRGPMPVFHSRWNPDNIALSNLLDGAAPLLNPTRAVRYDQDLTEGMRMPCTPRAGLECNLSAGCARWIVRGEEGLDRY